MASSTPSTTSTVGGDATITLEVPRPEVGLSASSASGNSRPEVDATSAGPAHRQQRHDLAHLAAQAGAGRAPPSTWASPTVADTSRVAQRGEASTARLATAWSSRPPEGSTTCTGVGLWKRPNHGQLEVGHVLVGGMGLDHRAAAAGPLQRGLARRVQIAHHGIDAQSPAPGRVEPSVGRYHQVGSPHRGWVAVLLTGDEQRPCAPLHGRNGVGSTARPSMRNSKCR